MVGDLGEVFRKDEEANTYCRSIVFLEEGAGKLTHNPKPQGADQRAASVREGRVSKGKEEDEE
jgi:hypothetical protein